MEHPIDDEVKTTRGLWNAFVKLLVCLCCITSVAFCLTGGV